MAGAVTNKTVNVERSPAAAEMTDDRTAKTTTSDQHDIFILFKIRQQGP